MMRLRNILGVICGDAHVSVRVLKPDSDIGGVKVSSTISFEGNTRDVIKHLETCEFSAVNNYFEYYAVITNATGDTITLVCSQDNKCYQV